MKSLKLLLIAALTIFSVAGFAQDTTKHKMPKQHVSKMTYSCTMHPDVTSDKPGKCSKCGADLVLSKKQQMKMEVMKIYTCSMHPEVTSDKAGKCSKCGMDLVLSKKEQMKMEVMKIYSCPMHADVTSAKPGKCSKCGMDLTEAKATYKPKKS